MAKGRLRAINQKITELENYINHAVLIEPVSDSSRVQLGSTVTIEANGVQRTYTILGSSESDPDKNIISHQSPIGSLLMGKKVGDSVHLKLSDRTIEYRIIAIK
jgi:transcription elongation factor GreA